MSEKKLTKVQLRTLREMRDEGVIVWTFHLFNYELKEMRLRKGDQRLPFRFTYPTFFALHSGGYIEEETRVVVNMHRHTTYRLSDKGRAALEAQS